MRSNCNCVPAEGGAGFTRRRLNQADVSDGETDEAESDDGSSVVRLLTYAAGHMKTALACLHLAQ